MPSCVRNVARAKMCVFSGQKNPYLDLFENQFLFVKSAPNSPPSLCMRNKNINFFRTLELSSNTWTAISGSDEAMGGAIQQGKRLCSAGRGGA